MARDAEIIVLEEHYCDPELDVILGRQTGGPLDAYLLSSLEARILRLDRLGIAVEVLSLAPPGLQGVTDAQAVALAVRVNDRLGAMVRASNGRLAAFAALPTADPAAAAEELRRCVGTHGFVGAMVHGPTGGVFLDDHRFDPIFATAAQLNVPIYVHPSEIKADVRAAYLAPYDQTHPMLLRAGWGYTIETSTHAVRLVLSNLFDRYPDLQIILGHLGEGIPYMLDRIDEALSRDTPMKRFKEIFQRNFAVTSSGFFSTPALACCLAQMGPSRVMFSIDAPFASERAGLDWLAGLKLDTADARAFKGANARQLLTNLPD